LDNTNFDFKKVVKEDVKGVDGAFVLRSVMTKEECLEVKSHMFGDPTRKHHHKDLFSSANGLKIERKRKES